VCFIPHVATKTAPVLFQRMEHPPGTALHCLQDQYAAVKDKFTLPHVAELQLANGCGCWLRHVDYPDLAEMEWYAEWKPTQPDFDPSNQQGNHEALADFLEANFRQDGFVEFFGYFDGDASQPARARKEVPVSAIRQPNFFFFGGTLYRFTFD
jgi:hypothetical protein